MALLHLSMLSEAATCGCIDVQGYLNMLANQHTGPGVPAVPRDAALMNKGGDLLRHVSAHAWWSNKARPQSTNSPGSKSDHWCVLTAGFYYY